MWGQESPDPGEVQVGPESPDPGDTQGGPESPVPDEAQVRTTVTRYT